ncbi:MAG: fasciclin domain-containing protein [Caldilineaceae bacterium]
MQKLIKICGLILAAILLLLVATNTYAQYTPLVSVKDQDVVDGQITVASAVINGPGWIVIHADDKGSPGQVVGYAPLAAGTNADVAVPLDTAHTTDVLYAMLHIDEGKAGAYEFPGPDVPVAVDDKPVMSSFKVTGTSLSVVGTLLLSDGFKMLVNALKAAGLEKELRGEGPFTVFAPTNAAFAALPKGKLDELLADPAQLKQVLLYHVLKGSVPSADLKDGQDAETLQGASLKVSLTDGKIKVNEATVIAKDLAAHNGVVHVVDQVLVPPAEALAAAATVMTPTVTSTATPVPPTATPTEAPTNTATATTAPTDTSTATTAPTDTSTATTAPTDTSTATSAPTDTATTAPTDTATATPAPTDTATATTAPTDTPTPAPTATPTAAPTETPTPTPAPTDTPVPTATEAPTATSTATEAPTATQAVTETQSVTAAQVTTTTAAVTGTQTVTAVQATTATETVTATAATTGSTQAPAGKDIVDTASEAGDFTTLLDAAQATQLVDTLKGPGPFTIFAPTDAAFTALPEGTLDALKAQPDLLKQVLLYHVAAGKIPSSELTDRLLIKTQQGDLIKVTAKAGSIRVNDANVVKTDIDAANGVIHVIDSVLIPQTVVEALTPKAPVTGTETTTTTQVTTSTQTMTPTTTVSGTQSVTPTQAASGQGNATSAGGTAATPQAMPETGGSFSAAGATLPAVVLVILALAVCAVATRERPA